jgi:hypothetical protein
MTILNSLLLGLCLTLLSQCSPVASTSSNQPDYLVSFVDTKGEYGYQDAFGRTIIPLGKYSVCYTDTFRTFAIVSKRKAGLVAINRAEKVLYEVFSFDNGPDYPKEGLFRITKSGKIGYADARTGLVVIQPSFTCAFPFINGRAKVSNECTSQTDGEHRSWVSEKWFYIDKQGQEVK